MKKNSVNHTQQLNEADLNQAIWRKSSFSGNGDCVEVAFVNDYTAVRHTKHRDGGTLVFNKTEWDAFLTGVRQGEFDRTDAH
jgi:Domain of unknown function (DUF397)